MIISERSEFRKDINGLRAFAVIGVIFFHYKLEFFSGGFSGVDVFFVISGFLMTKIIISGINKKSFNYWSFLKKRTQRIVPAWIFLVLSVLVGGFFLCYPDDYREILKSSASSLTFLSNMLYWKNSNYFAPASENNFLLHTWSLSVEWQFYLVYPFIIMLFKSLTADDTKFKLIFIGTTIVLMLSSFYFTTMNATASFYLLPSRSWEMLMGGVIFLLNGSSIINERKRLVSMTGYILILCCFIFLQTSQNWPGVFTIFPVLGAFLVIIANDNEIAIVNNALVQFCGKISYSLYLWHWPLFVILQYYGYNLTPLLISILILASILLSYFTYKYIENVKYKNTKLIVGALASLFLISIAFFKFNSNRILYSDQILQVSGYMSQNKKERDRQYNAGTCHAVNFLSYNKSACLCFNDNKKNILLLGDSHMGQLSSSFIEYSKNRKIHFLQATASATLPLLNDYQHRDAKRRELMDYIFKTFIPANAARIDGIIMTGSWSGQDKRLLNKEQIGKAIIETIKYLETLNIKTIVIGETERYIIPYPTIAARGLERGQIENLKYIDNNGFNTDAYLNENIKEVYVKVINTKEFPPIMNRTIPYMIDKHHVSKYGADLIVKKVSQDPKFLNLLK